jgi:integrase/recombinase XerD
MMNDWYQRMVDTLQLNGKGERTQQAYTRSVRMLSQFYEKTPDRVSEQELQEYFLHRKNINHWSPKTMRICYCGYAFSTRKSFSATGTSSVSSEPKLNDAFPPS